MRFMYGVIGCEEPNEKKEGSVKTGLAGSEQFDSDLYDNNRDHHIRTQLPEKDCGGKTENR